MAAMNGREKTLCNQYPMSFKLSDFMVEPCFEFLNDRGDNFENFEKFRNVTTGVNQKNIQGISPFSNPTSQVSVLQTPGLPHLSPDSIAVNCPFEIARTHPESRSKVSCIHCMSTV